jgi:adenylate kinase family enzyme
MMAHINKRILEGGNRKDDTDESVVCKRIESFKAVTMPAIQWLSENSDVKFFDIKLPTDDINTNFEHIYHTIF